MRRAVSIRSELRFPRTSSIVTRGLLFRGELEVSSSSSSRARFALRGGTPFSSPVDAVVLQRGYESRCLVDESKAGELNRETALFSSGASTSQLSPAVEPVLPSADALHVVVFRGLWPVGFSQLVYENYLTMNCCHFPHWKQIQPSPDTLSWPSSS